MAQDSVNFTVSTSDEEPEYPWLNWVKEKINELIGG